MNKNILKIFLISLISASVGLLEGFALARHGVFQDTEIYFLMYQDLHLNGFYSAVLTFFLNTGKFEPFIFFIFWFIGLIDGDFYNEFYFLSASLILLNFLLAMSWIKMQGLEKIKLTHVLFILLVLLSYLVFSKTMYFWRSVLALCFFVMSVYSLGKFKYLFGAMAVLSHSTFLVFYLAFLILKFFFKTNNKVWIKVLSASLLVSFGLKMLPGFMSRLVSGGDVDALTAAGEGHSLVVWSTVIFSLCILFLIRKEMLMSPRHREFYLFLVLLCLASFFMLDSYHLMNRVFLPVSLAVGFLSLSCAYPKGNVFIVRILIVFSVLPSVRLFYNLSTGQFIFS